MLFNTAIKSICPAQGDNDISLVENHSTVFTVPPPPLLSPGPLSIWLWIIHIMPWILIHKLSYSEELEPCEQICNVASQRLERWVGLGSPHPWNLRRKITDISYDMNDSCKVQTLYCVSKRFLKHSQLQMIAVANSETGYDIIYHDKIWPIHPSNHQSVVVVVFLICHPCQMCRMMSWKPRFTMCIRQLKPESCTIRAIKLGFLNH